MADHDAVRPLGEPMDAEQLDRLKIVSRREFELILQTSSYRLKPFLQAKVVRVGTTEQS